MTVGIIPIALKADPRPASLGYGDDTYGVVDKGVPGVAAGFDDLVVAVTCGDIRWLPRGYSHTFSTGFNLGAYGGRRSKVMFFGPRAPETVWLASAAPINKEYAARHRTECQPRLRSLPAALMRQRKDQRGKSSARRRC